VEVWRLVLLLDPVGGSLKSEIPRVIAQNLSNLLRTQSVFSYDDARLLPIFKSPLMSNASMQGLARR
jgi:hypothetical protein